MDYLEKSYRDSKRAPPLNTEDYGYWKILFRAHLDALGILYTIDEDRPCPEVSQSHVSNLRRRNRDAEAEEYTSSQTKAKSKWIRDHAVSFNETLTACGTNYDANTIIMQNTDKKAKSIVTKLDERFGIEGQIGTIQFKVATFSNMLIDTPRRELASRYLGRLTRAGNEINGSGSGILIDFNIHGVSRIKEGLLHDPRYETLCHVLRGQPKLTWDETTNQILDFERSNEVFLSSDSARPATSSSRAPTASPAELRRMVTKSVRHEVNRWQKVQPKRSHRRGPKRPKPNPQPAKKNKKHLQCHHCKKYGHVQKECRQFLALQNKDTPWHNAPRQVNLRFLHFAGDSDTGSNGSDAESGCVSSDESLVRLNAPRDLYEYIKDAGEMNYVTPERSFVDVVASAAPGSRVSSEDDATQSDLESISDVSSTNNGPADVDPTLSYVNSEEDMDLFRHLQWVQRTFEPGLVLPDPESGPVGPACRQLIEFLQVFPARPTFRPTTQDVNNVGCPAVPAPRTSRENLRAHSNSREAYNVLHRSVSQFEHDFADGIVDSPNQTVPNKPRTSYHCSALSELASREKNCKHTSEYLHRRLGHTSFAQRADHLKLADSSTLAASAAPSLNDHDVEESYSEFEYRSEDSNASVTSIIIPDVSGEHSDADNVSLSSGSDSESEEEAVQYFPPYSPLNYHSDDDEDDDDLVADISRRRTRDGNRYNSAGDKIPTRSTRSPQTTSKRGRSHATSPPEDISISPVLDIIESAVDLVGIYADDVILARPRPGTRARWVGGRRRKNSPLTSSRRRTRLPPQYTEYLYILSSLAALNLHPAALFPSRGRDTAVPHSDERDSPTGVTSHPSSTPHCPAESSYYDDLDAFSSYISDTDGNVSYVSDSDGDALSVVDVDMDGPYVADGGVDVPYVLDMDADTPYSTDVDVDTPYDADGDVDALYVPDIAVDALYVANLNVDAKHVSNGDADTTCAYDSELDTQYQPHVEANDRCLQDGIITNLYSSAYFTAITPVLRMMKHGNGNNGHRRKRSRTPSRNLSNAHPDSKFQAVVDSGANSTVVTPDVVSAVGSSNITRVSSVVHTGKAGADIDVVGTGSLGQLDNVVVVPSQQLRESCISIPRLDLAGHWTVFGGQQAYLLDENLDIKAVGQLQEDLTYRWDIRDLAGPDIVTSQEPPTKLFLGHAVQTVPTLDLLHRRLGHRNKRCIRDAIVERKITGLPEMSVSNAKTGLCPDCARAKSTRQSYNQADTHPHRAVRPTVPLNPVISVISTDLKGPLSTTAWGGERYFQLFIEAETKFRYVKFLTYKSDAFENLKQLVSVDLKSEGSRILKYHSDGAPELISARIKAFLADNQALLSFSPPYTPQKNSLVERSNRTIWESAHAMLLACSLSMIMWRFAVEYAILIDRCLPTNTASGWMTPFEAKYGVVPYVDLFRVFGCIAYVHIEESQRETAADKAYPGFFVGFEENFFDRVRVFVPELDRVVVSAHVSFDEITKVTRKTPAMLEVVDTKSKLDFQYLVGLVYLDPEDRRLYVTTTIRV